MKTLFAILIMSHLGNTLTAQENGAYFNIDGLSLYYEVKGNGSPLVLIHGGGSTIESSFGRLLPELTKNYKVIAVDMEAHGRTKDIGRSLSFERDADNIAALLDHLNIERASVLGFSNGATTAVQIAIRHPERVDRLVLASALTKRSGVDPGFWEGFKQPHIGMMPQALKDAYLEVSPDEEGLQTMFERDVQRMRDFKDIPDETIQKIAVPVLILNSDKDVIKPEHALELYRLLPKGQLLIVPGVHGEWMDEAGVHKDNNPLPALVLPMVKRFLDTSSGDPE